jgi:hypothetical protein
MSEAGLIEDGMLVLGAEGDELGRVLHVIADGFIVRGDGAWGEDHLFTFGDVAEVRDGEVHLHQRRDELDELASDEAQGAGFGRAHQPAASGMAASARGEPGWSSTGAPPRPRRR